MRLALLLITAFLASLLGAPEARADPPPPLSPVPAGFHWGVATAGFQSEGSAPDSNWRRYVEQDTASVVQPYANAVDFRNRYPADIALARDLGVTTFRYSVEWARVQPRPGEWDEAELAYYDDLLREVRAAGLTPMITLSHFVHPGWVADRGGWAAASTVDDFLAFAGAIAERYADAGALWITINEPTRYRDLEVDNGGIRRSDGATMMTNLVAAHRGAYAAIHAADPDAQVSSNLAYQPPPLQAGADAEFVDRVADTLDFVGIDYYYGASLDNLSAIWALTGQFWRVAPQPDGLYHALRSYQRKFPTLPLYVVENGMPTQDGRARPDGYTRSQHLRDHLYWMQRAMAEGVRVIGYNYWSLTDNYEWGDYRARFGLYTVDALTDPALARRPTDAVPTYRETIAAGGVPPAYLPVRRPAWCAFADLRTCVARPPFGP